MNATLIGLFSFWLAGAASAQNGTLSDVDRLRIQIVDLQAQLADAYAQTDACRVQLAPYRKAENDAAVQKARSELKARIEAAHPGYAFDVETRHLTPKPSQP